IIPLYALYACHFKEGNMFFTSVLLISIAFVSANTSDRDEYTNKYIDEVLSIHLPKAVEDAEIDGYHILPNIATSLPHDLTEDGLPIRSKTVSFHSGKIEGFSSAHRKSCERLPTSTDNIKVICNIVLPRVAARYRGRYEVLIGHPFSQGYRVRRRDFEAETIARDIEARIEIKAFDEDGKPSLTDLVLIGKGEVETNFKYDDANKKERLNRLDDVPFEKLRGFLYQKNSQIFQKVFKGIYRYALEDAVSSIVYPEHD
ncbi:uncharacterized protein NPIL_258021, partial [Nephila pilipes]